MQTVEDEGNERNGRQKEIKPRNPVQVLPYCLYCCASTSDALNVLFNTCCVLRSTHVTKQGAEDLTRSHPTYVACALASLPFSLKIDFFYLIETYPETHPFGRRGLPLYFSYAELYLEALLSPLSKMWANIYDA
jgi:hypothetical protein